MTTDLVEMKKIPILRVLTLIEQGISVSEACSEVGIARPTFYRILAEYPELPQEIAETRVTELENRIAKVRRARWQMQDKIIQDAEDPQKTFRERLALDSKLAEIEDNLEKQLALISKKEPSAPTDIMDKAGEFLKQNVGVQLRPSKGKITQTVEFDIERIEGEIIEGEVKGE